MNTYYVLIQKTERAYELIDAETEEEAIEKVLGKKTEILYGDTEYEIIASG